MKILTLIFFSFSLISFSTDIPKKNDLQEKQLKGKVRVVTENVYYLDAKSRTPIMEEKAEKRISYFNLNGNEVKFERYNEKNILEFMLKTQYNDRNDIIQQQNQGLDTNKKTFIHYTYDKANHLVARTFIGTGKVLDSFKYDHSGQEIKEQHWYFTPDTIFTKTLTMYDSFNRVIEKEDFGANTAFSTTSTYTYDGKNNVKDLIRVNSLSYNKSSFGYNNEKLLVSEYRIGDWGRYKIKYEYSDFDGNGNWLTMKRIEMHVPKGKQRTVLVFQRQIEYY